MYDEHIAIKSLKDIEENYQIFLNEIRGFKLLNTADKATFEKFIVNFLDAQGFKKNIEATSIVREKEYLRFDYKMQNRKEWLHITGNGDWY